MEQDCKSRILIAKNFSNFEEFSATAKGWNADFRQVSTQQFGPKLIQAWLSSILISRARFGCHVVQQGTTPAGMRTFAILDADTPPMRWFGHTVDPNVLLAFPVHREIEVFSRPEFSVSTISVPETILGEFFDKNGGPVLGQVLGAGEIITRLPSIMLEKARSLVRQAIALLQKGGSLAPPHHLYSNIQNEILSFLLEALRAAKDGQFKSRKYGGSSIECIVKYIHGGSSEKISIADICYFAQVSERTLRNKFKRELGMSPKEFLTGYRLDRVHHELYYADISKTLVSDIANCWGFWHMGKFAADYKKLYGELPSQTLKRKPVLSYEIYRPAVSIHT